MIRISEIIRLSSMGLSQRTIASSLQCSRNTVSDVLVRAGQNEIIWPLPDDVTDAQLLHILFPERAQQSPYARPIPDCEWIHRELAKSGVTLSLLWTEYCEQCRNHQQIPLMYSQFCNYYRNYARTQKVSMHIQRKPGEQLEVDWAGQTAAFVDRETGELIPVSIFVAVLSSSLYTYVEGFLSQNQENWIAAHVDAFSYFGGVPKIIVPDNLKTGVTRSDRYEPTINKTYQKMAEHYGTAIIPARVRKPQDKPNVESGVNLASTWILASLRNQTFFSLHELNEAIAEKLEQLNEKPFQKKPGNRRSIFLTEEQPMLQPLPNTPYEIATWKVATVHINYHISVDLMHYSVPYEYVRQQVDVRISRNMIEVFFQQQRICSHVRLFGKTNQYRTNEEHMPDKHRQFVQWNGERFLSWGKQVGPHTHAVIAGILQSKLIEQQSYRTCMGVLKLADKYSVARLEAACAKAKTYTPTPSYKNISAILKAGQDKILHDTPFIQSEEEKQAPSKYGFTRGADYYGRKS